MNLNLNKQNDSKKKSLIKSDKYLHTNSSKIKLPKLEELLKTSIDNEQPGNSDIENKLSSELNLQEDDTSSNQKKLKSKDSTSLAEIALKKNSNAINNINNSSNQTSTVSSKTIRKPFNKTGLLNKSQLKLASYIEQNKDITLTGTKRFTDKTGEYYLKNVQLQKKQDNQPLSKKLSLTHPQNLDNCFNKLNGNINKIKRNATKIITILPENSLTPIPVKEPNSVRGIAKSFDKRQYQNAERVAVFIRRMEYSNGMKSHFKAQKKNVIYLNKIIFLQEWWKTMYKILVIQKNLRGFFFRKHLMKILEHQENILKFITTFYNIHGFHLYRTFFNNLKKICEQIKSKRTELLEDFCEKIEKIEYKNNLKKLKKYLIKWKKIIQNEINKEKAERFRKYNLRKKGIKGLKKNYISKLINDVLDKNKNNNNSDLLDEIFNNKNIEKILKGIKLLNKVYKNTENKIKKEIYKKFNEYLLIKKEKEKENNKKMLLKAFLTWRKITEGKNVLELLKNYKIVKKNLLKMNSILNKYKEEIDFDNKIKAFDLLKAINQRKKQQIKKLKIILKRRESKENSFNNSFIFNDSKDSENINNNNNNKSFDENINLKKTKTFLNNYLENNNNNNIKPFKKRISYRRRPKKNKKSKKDKLNQKLNQLKKVSLLLLLRLYKNQKNKIIKKYFDKWKNKFSQKYIKKIISKNSLNISKDSKLSDKSNKNNAISNINIEKTLDSTKKKNEQLKSQEINSDEDTSINMSIMSDVINLEEAKCENMKPVIYTSQSFIIDKNTINEIQNEFPKFNYYKNVNNKYPMKMKGDFRQLIVKNKDLLQKLNPRIQITNATCELEQFSLTDNSNPKNNINNINILNINPNISINMSKSYKKKDLKKVINNCDKDIYKPNNNIEGEKQRWISMSIPLDNDMANWNFLNSVSGIRNKDNINKFEVIQKNRREKNNQSGNYNIIDLTNKIKYKEENDIRNLKFKLKEMNYRQNPEKNEKVCSPIKLVKYNKQNFNKNRKVNNNFSVDINNNIEELSEESID